MSVENMAANIVDTMGFANPMNLKLFAEEGPEPAAPAAEPTEPIAQEPTEPTPGPAQQEPTETQAFARRLKESTEKAKQEALDSFIEQTYGQSHGIRTYAEYQKALDAQKQQEEVNRLVQQNIPQQYAQEMLENRKFREQYQTERQRAEQAEKQQKQYAEFMEAYKDVQPDQIPEEVWQDVKGGRALLDAYVRYENKSLKGELEKYRQQQQAAQANQANAASSTGSVKGTGAPDSGYISKEVFDANKHDQNWMNKNYDKIMQSMRKWGK
jgi:uncharacterized protein (DUF849 family)